MVELEDDALAVTENGNRTVLLLQVFSWSERNRMGLKNPGIPTAS